MHRFLIFLTTLCCAVTSQYASASKEGVLLWSEFVVTSQGIGSSGPVRVSGKQTSSGITQLKIEAFGREFVAPDTALIELRGFFANGMLLSYEHGYTKLRGRTVYLSFMKGFTSGVTETMRLSVSESGQFQFLKGAGK